MPKIIGTLEAGNADGKLLNVKYAYDENQNKNQEDINSDILSRVQSLEGNPPTPTPGEGGGGIITVDSELSSESTNPVQNKVITEALASINLRIDNEAGNVSPMTEEEYEAVEDKEFKLYFIMKDGELEKIYYGSTLIAYKASDGNLSNVFPMVFPFVFG